MIELVGTYPDSTKRPDITTLARDPIPEPGEYAAIDQAIDTARAIAADLADPPPYWQIAVVVDAIPVATFRARWADRQPSTVLQVGGGPVSRALTQSNPQKPGETAGNTPP